MRGQSSISYRVGIDLMGSDSSPRELLEAVLSYSSNHHLPSGCHLVFFGTEEIFTASSLPPRIESYPVTEVIGMEEAPLTAVRTKKNSSLCTGIRLLKEGKLDAFISAGNTGALLASATLALPLIPGIVRPALLTLLPTKNKELAVLDVGANTICRADLLIQHACLGIAYQHSRGILLPKVGLLNIGSEACKGTPELKEVYSTLEKMSQAPSAKFAFIGNIEGRDAFHGEIDVLVTDGFTGNVFLKTAEGIAAVILEQLQQDKTLMLTEVCKRLNYAEYPGALLCGVEGIVIKCHGNISSQSLTRSISTACQLLENSFLKRVCASMANDSLF